MALSSLWGRCRKRSSAMTGLVQPALASEATACASEFECFTEETVLCIEGAVTRIVRADNGEAGLRELGAFLHHILAALEGASVGRQTPVILRFFLTLLIRPDFTVAIEGRRAADLLLGDIRSVATESRLILQLLPGNGVMMCPKAQKAP